MSKNGNSLDLDGLLGLATTAGIDVRPTLLRVLTDLFVQRRIRSIDAARQYILITLRLLDSADLETRKTVAAKLARDSMAPLQIVERLARDDIAVAEPILRYSARLYSHQLAEIAQAKGGAHAAIINERHQIAPEVSTPTPVIGAGQLADTFFDAGPAERRLILMSLDYAGPADETVPPQTPEVTRRLETAALKGDAAGVARELQSALGISAALAHRVVADDSGEPLVAAAKALGCPAAVLQRMLLFVNPAIGHSVDQTYQLAQLYGEVSAQAARELVAIWRDADPAGPVVQRHAPMFAETKEIRSEQVRRRDLQSPPRRTANAS